MESQKRTLSDRDNLLEGVQTILLDIEGTTTPISFVKETLFPYVKENVKSYLESHWEDEECKEDVESLRQQANKDKEDKVEGFVEMEDGEEAKASVVNNIMWQMGLDRKTTSLKQLQGHIWREAYKTGKLQGEVFDDVVPAVKSWTSSGKKVFIYSSGSVEAQKLLFGHSNHGDLREHISGYFDTEVGPKVEKESYAKIVKQAECNADECLFLTDLPTEAKAAAEAGLSVCLVEREGNAAISEEDQQRFNTISNFGQLQEDPCAGGDGKIAKTDVVDSTNGDAEQGDAAPASDDSSEAAEVAADAN